MVERSIPQSDTNDGGPDQHRPDALRGLSPEVIGELRAVNASLGGRKVEIIKKK